MLRDQLTAQRRFATRIQWLALWLLAAAPASALTPLRGGLRPLPLPVLESGSDREDTDPALAEFRARHGGAWHARYDARTQRPVLVWGSGLALIPGRANSLSEPRNPALADLERMIREILRTAPGFHGVSDTDLQLQPARSGSFAGGRVWLVDFDRLEGGIAVAGSRVFARIVDGNLIQVGFDLVFSSPTLDQGLFLAREVALERGLAALGGLDPGDRILSQSELRLEPRLVSGGQSYETVAVWPIAIAKAGRHEVWQVLLDATSGNPVEIFDGNAYDSNGLVLGMVNPRTVGEDEIQVPFRLQTVELGGTTVVTDFAGYYSNPGVGPQVIFSLGGKTPEGGFTIENQSGLPSARVAVPFDPSMILHLWESGMPNSTPAERNAFYHLHVARAQARARIPLPWSNSVVTANVGSDLVACNAFWDRTNQTLNFFSASAGCANTAEIADVLMHEWGHGLDQNTGGGLDQAGGEAIGDLTSWLQTRDPVFAPRFQDSANPPFIGTLADASALRDISQPVSLANIAERCPLAQPRECVGPMGYECHCEGLVLGGAMWDLGVALRERYGETGGWELLATLHYNALRAWTNYTQVADALYAFDDDNANPLDGTPNGCLIDAAFTAHGIGSTSVACSAPYVALRLAGTIVQDLAGNGDGVLDPGETIDLVLEVHNAGNAASSGGSAEVSSGVLSLTVLDANALFPVIASGATTTSLAPAPRLKVDPGVACGTVLPIAVDLVDGASPRRELASLTVGRGGTSRYREGFESGAGGWSNTGNAATGSWIAGTPQVTAHDGDVYQPEGARVGSGALYTGVRATWDGIGDGDVDGGAAVALSPSIDLTAASHPVVELYYWFVSARGATQPNDVFQVLISNGSTEVELYRDTGPTRDWRFLSLPLDGRIDVTSTMRIKVIASDDTAAGNYVEAAIDEVAIVDFSCTSVCPFAAVATATAATELCSGESTALVASVTGCAGPGYQWLQDGVAIPGATAMSYVSPSSLPPGDYRFAVEVACPSSPGCLVRTTPITVTVTSAEAVVTTPSPIEVCLDRPVVADGSSSTVGNCAGGALHEWWLDGSPIAGASGSTLAVAPGAIAAGLHQLSLRVTCATSPRCSDESAPLALRVTEVRARLTTPGPVFACVGTPASLDASTSTVTGCAASPSFQWSLAGADIPGATSPTYTTPVLPLGTYAYGVRVACGQTSLACASESNVDVVVTSSVVPTVVPGSLLAVRRGAGAHLTWDGVGSGAFQVHRVGRKEDLPTILSAPGVAATTGTAVTIADAEPPSGVWLYQVFGADCFGRSYP